MPNPDTSAVHLLPRHNNRVRWVEDDMDMWSKPLDANTACTAYLELTAQGFNARIYTKAEWQRVWNGEDQ